MSSIRANLQDIESGNYSQILEQLDRKDAEIAKILEPLEISKLSKKDTLESYPIGDFLNLFNKKVRRLQKSESPDFLVEFEDGLKVGIEHSMIVSDSTRQIASLKKLVKEAESVFRSKYPEEKEVWAEIVFKKNSFSYKKSNVPKLSEDIADYIFCILNNQGCEKPEFLQSPIYKWAVHRCCDYVCFSFGEGGYIVNPLTPEVLERSIRKKEKKLSMYRSNNKNLSEIWLALFLTGSGSDGLSIREEIDYSIDSTFNKVFVTDTLRNKIVNVKS
jgi:hypothetical protein